MPEPTNIEKLEGARNDIADVYADEAKDNIHDNGNLSVMNNALLSIETAIQTLKARNT